MPLCARSGNGRAISDFNPWWYVRTINHFRVGAKSMWILPGVQRQGEPDGNDTFAKFDLSVLSMSPRRTTL